MLRLVRSSLALLLMLPLVSSCGSDGAGPDTGTLVVVISTTGATPDPDGYTLQAGARTESVTTGELLTLGGLAAGSTTVELSGLAINCTVQGDNPRTVTVTAGQTTQIEVTVDCPFALFDRIVFYSDRTGNDEVHSMAPDGSDVVQITDNPDEDQFPGISPDGTTIFWYRRDNPSIVLYRMNADGTGIERFTPAEPRMLENQPDFSPDGEWIVHTRNLSDVGFNNLHLSRVDGSERMALTTDDVGDVMPGWSPDGSLVVFSRLLEEGFRLHTVAADGSALTRLTDHDGGELYPDWSPDGTTILYSHEDAEGDYDLYLMDTNGSNVRPLLEREGNQMFGQWSPDGTRIAFAGNSDGEYRIYVMKADGSGLQLVTPEFGARWPRWTPMR